MVERYPNAVIFDLDGTLAETAPDLHAVLVELLGPEGVPAPPLSALRAMVGDGAQALIRRSYAAAGIRLEDDKLAQLFQRFLQMYTESSFPLSTVFAGVVPGLQTLAEVGVKLGVCTNKPQAATLPLLEKLGLRRRFGSIIGGDRIPFRKPHPDHLRAVAGELAVDPRASVMVGDSRNDLEPARALEMPCVLVSFGYTAIPARELGADAVIDHFDDLLPTLRRLA